MGDVGGQPFSGRARDVQFKSLPCWNVTCQPTLKSWAPRTWFSSRISLYYGAFIFPSITFSHSIPAAEKHPHNMMMPPPCFTVRIYWAGDQQCPFSSTHALPLRIETEEFSLGVISSGILISHSLEVLKVFFCNSVPCAEARLLTCCSVLAQIGGALQWWLSVWNFLSSPLRTSGAQPEWSLDSWLPLSLTLLSPSCSFGLDSPAQKSWLFQISNHTIQCLFVLLLCSTLLIYMLIYIFMH